jgi:DNA-binding LacI/PurR family transcriptional regulator
VAIAGRPSGNCRVSPPVAEKVRAVARELNYRPNLQARNLSAQRTYSVALLVKRAAWHNAMFYVSACQRVLREFGFSEIIMLHPDDEVATERAHLEMCVERQVEGIIAIPLIDLESRSNVEVFNRIQREEKIPIVQLGLALEGCDAPSVTADETGGMRQGVKLLHAMGHRRIAHCTIRGYDNAKPINPFRIGHLRYLGYQQAMRELGIEEELLIPEQRVTDISMLYDSAREVAKQVAASQSRPTAIVAFSDYMGAGLIAGFKDHGLRVPEDVSVLSVGEQIFTRMMRPTMSTLAPQFEKMGELASAMLLKMIEGKPGVSTMVLPSLNMRESVREISA